MISTVMVLIMVALASVFFFLVDSILHYGVERGFSDSKGWTQSLMMTKRWYIVHAYSNFEKKVAELIKEQSVQKGLGDLFEQVLVPTEEVIEVRRGRKIKSERRFFPGYVLVKMELTDQAFHLIKNTPKVTGFLGSDNKPIPITDAEAATASSTRCRRRRTPEDLHHLRNRRAGSRRRWSFRFLQRPG